MLAKEGDPSDSKSWAQNAHNRLVIYLNFRGCGLDGLLEVKFKNIDHSDSDSTNHLSTDGTRRRFKGVEQQPFTKASTMSSKAMTIDQSQIQTALLSNCLSAPMKSTMTRVMLS